MVSARNHLYIILPVSQLYTIDVSIEENVCIAFVPCRFRWVVLGLELL